MTSRQALLANLPLASLALALAACSSTPEEPRGGDEEDVNWLVTHGRYDEAVERAAERSADRPGDEEAEELHRLASTAWLLERGRRLYFEGRDQEALEVFREAQRIAPPRSPADAWIEMTLDRLADRRLEQGLERHNDDDLDAAIALYEQALSFRPAHPQAREVLARALVQKNHRLGMSAEYYDDGIRALDRYFLYQARTLFDYVLKYEPGNDRAERRGQDAQALLGSDRAALAAGLEEDGNFAGARNEYRLALLLDPNLTEARLGLERTQREEQASEKLREAERLLLKQRFDAAEELLEQSRVLTERQGDAFDRLAEAIQEGRLATLYEQARTLESDGRYVEAVEAFERLLQKAPFFRDAIARKDTLESFVSEADEIYARYEAAASDPERLALLQQIAVFWPEYRDVRSRLAQLSGEAPPR